MLSKLLMIVALILLVLASFGVAITANVSLGWLGLSFWALSIVLARVNIS